MSGIDKVRWGPMTNFSIPKRTYPERRAQDKASVLVLAALCLTGSLSLAEDESAALPNAPKPQPAMIVGTAVGGQQRPRSRRHRRVEGPISQPRKPCSRTPTASSNSKTSIPQAPIASASAPKGFAGWTSPNLTLQPGQYLILPIDKLCIAEAMTKVTVGCSGAEVASEQGKIEEQQRILGSIPNFYVSREPDASPLTAKLKFKLAAKVAFDPITFFGVGVAATAEQAGEHPNYREGAQGYAERYGAVYNGAPEPNYSTRGGRLASAAIANARYPPSNRGAGLVFSNFLIGTGQRVAANLAQEFLFRRPPPRARNQK